MATLLNYFSPAPATADELGFEKHRAELLRRRVRTYCGVLGAIGILRGLAAIDGSATRWWILLAAIVEVSALTSIFLRLGPTRTIDRAVVSHVSMGLVAATGALWLLAARLDGRGVDSGLWTLFWRHLLAAIILPWTWREALIAAALLAGANGTILFSDLLRRAGGLTELVLFPIFAPAMVIPGIVLSWWRHSRFRQRHQLTAESAMYRSLSREIEGARRLHETCMPAEITQGAIRLHYTYQPHRQLGGDLIYVFPSRPTGDDPFTLIVLDVAGHGIAAALTVNRIVGEIERMIAEAEAEHPDASSAVGSGGPNAGPGVASLTPAVVAMGLNKYVRLTLAHHALFATALIVRVDPRHGRLTWVNCGHPPAYLHAPDRRLRMLEADTMMLGVTDEQDLGAVEQTEAFEPGTVLLAVTDGATEARSPSGQCLQMAGVERIVASVRDSGAPPEQWPRRVAEALAAYRQAPADDDTLLVVLSNVGPSREGPGRRSAGMETQEPVAAMAGGR